MRIQTSVHIPIISGPAMTETLPQIICLEPMMVKVVVMKVHDTIGKHLVFQMHGQQKQVTHMQKIQLVRNTLLWKVEIICILLLNYLPLVKDHLT